MRVCMHICMYACVMRVCMFIMPCHVVHCTVRSYACVCACVRVCMFIIAARVRMQCVHVRTV